MTKVLFVCMANICRSPIAEAVARSKARDTGLAGAFLFDSAGIIGDFAGQPPDGRGIAALTQKGYAPPKTCARVIKRKDFDTFDMILALDSTVLHALKAICPTDQQHKLALFLGLLPNPGLSDVPDPYFGNIDGFLNAIALSEQAVEGLLASTQTSAIPSNDKRGNGLLHRLKRLVGIPL